MTQLNKEFEPCQQKYAGKRKKTFILAIMPHLHLGTHQLNHNAPKHEEFLDLARFMHDVATGFVSIEETLYEQFREATQERVLESIEEHDLFRFYET